MYSISQDDPTGAFWSVFVIHEGESLQINYDFTIITLLRKAAMLLSANNNSFLQKNRSIFSYFRYILCCATHQQLVLLIIVSEIRCLYCYKVTICDKTAAQCIHVNVRTKLYCSIVPLHSQVRLAVIPLV